MTEQIDYTKEIVLSKFPLLGVHMANVRFIATEQCPTLATNGENILYSPKFFNSCSEENRCFFVAHEIMHIAFDHVGRLEDKIPFIWNIATDAVINQMLQSEGWKIPHGAVDMPEAKDKSAREMYDLLMEKFKEEQKKIQEKLQNSGNQSSQTGGQGQQNPQAGDQNGRGQQQSQTGAQNGQGQQQSQTGAQNGQGQQQSQSGDQNGQSQQQSQSGDQNGQGQQNSQTGDQNGQGQQNPQTGDQNGQGQQNPQSGDQNGQSQQQSQSGDQNGQGQQQSQAGDQNGQGQQQSQTGDQNGQSQQQSQTGDQNGQSQQQSQAGDQNGQSQQQFQAGDQNGQSQQQSQAGDQNGQGQQNSQIGNQNGQGQQNSQAGDQNGQSQQQSQAGDQNGQSQQQSQAGNQNGQGQQQSQAGDQNGQSQQQSQAGDQNGQGQQQSQAGDQNGQSQQQSQAGDQNGQGQQNSQTSESNLAQNDEGSSLKEEKVPSWFDQFKNLDTHELWKKALEQKKKEEQKQKKDNKFSSQGMSFGGQSQQGDETNSDFDEVDADLKNQKETPDQNNEKDPSLSDKNFQEGQNQKSVAEEDLQNENQKAEAPSPEDEKYSEEEKNFLRQNKEVRDERGKEIINRLNERKHAYQHQRGRVREEEYEIDEGVEVANWKRILKKALLDEETRWSYRRANRGNDYMARSEELEEETKSETEVLLDVSGSVTEAMLRGFLHQLRPLLKHTTFKVGCFDSEFYGFKEIKKNSDIDSFRIVASGYQEDFDNAVRQFSKRKEVNKIVFTDGGNPPGRMPDYDLKKMNVIWIVSYNRSFDPCCGKVIHIDLDELFKKRLNCFVKQKSFFSRQRD